MKEGQFHAIGKEIPYRVPDGFFDAITAKTLAEMRKRDRLGRKRIILWSALSMAVSIALLITVRFPEPPGNEVAENRTEETAIPEKTDRESKDLLLTAKGYPETGNYRLTDKKSGEVKEDTPDNSRVLAELLSTLTDEELLQLAARFTTDLLTETTNGY